MNIVYYSSDFFSEMCGVAIQSLCENNQETKNITVYVVEDKICEKNKTRLEDIVKRYNREIVFIRMPSQKELYPEVKINMGRTYARMALADILPESVDRVLSLDSDTLVMDSLSEMYDTQFDENEYVAGVYDCVGSAIQNGVLHGGNHMRYCNAGMFLIDLKKWRSLDVGNQLLEAVERNADGKHTLYFLEQDLMNIVFDRHIRLLHPRYNLLTSIYLFEYDEVMKMKKPVSYYTKDEISYAKKHPAILHATTCFYVKKRMWVQGSDHPYHGFYLRYRQETGWRDDKQIEDARRLSKKVYGAFWHIMPRRIAVGLSSMVINKIRPSYAKLTAKANLPTIAEQSST